MFSITTSKTNMVQLIMKQNSTNYIFQAYDFRKVEPFLLDFIIRLYVCLFLYWVGVNPVCFLNAVLKEDFELKPTSKRIC